MKRALGLVAVVLLAGCGGAQQQPRPTGALGTAADQSATRDVAATEHMTCTARAFGLDPRGATDIDQVTTVYAWATCHDDRDGSSEVVPAAVDLDGAVRIPSDAYWLAEVKRIFPADVRQAVYDRPGTD
jgi:hypothetical protein